MYSMVISHVMHLQYHYNSYLILIIAKYIYFDHSTHTQWRRQDFVTGGK